MIIIIIQLGWPKRAPKQALNSTNEEKHVLQGRTCNSNTTSGFRKTQHLMQEASSVLTGWYGGRALYPVGAWPYQGQCEVVWGRAVRVDMWLTTQHSQDLSCHAPTGLTAWTPHQSVGTDEACDSSARANVCVSHLYWAWKCSWTKLCRSRGCCVLAELGLGGCSSELGPCTQRGQRKRWCIFISTGENSLRTDTHRGRRATHSETWFILLTFYLFATNCVKIRANDLTETWHERCTEGDNAHQSIHCNKHKQKKTYPNLLDFALCLQRLGTKLWKSGILRTRMYLKRDEPTFSLLCLLRQ